MKNHGRTSIYEFLGDLVVYRNLVPLDPRLPPLAQVRQQVGLPEGVIPRKNAPEYARVIVHLLQQARALDAPGTTIERLIYVGDTRMSDGAAFVNICYAGGWPGLAFIATENDKPAQVDFVKQEVGTLYLANRWSALLDFDRFCREHGISLNEQTAVIIDLDKTALGARGRNSHVIDQARVEAVRRTVGDLLGNAFDPVAFQTTYDRLNQVEFHPFTADNQDYLAYICLILASGLYSLDSLVAEVQAGRLTTFEQFIAEVDNRAPDLPAGLLPIHRRVHARVQQGDPTPFKTFRYNEYRTTIERMGHLDDSAPVAKLLKEEIIITQEVREMALVWREQGALLFGLSDKPDEASIPPGDLASQGYRPIHRVETHAVRG
jgi:hypothetical protein